MSTLEIKDLHVSIDTEQGTKEILKGVSLTIRTGETHAIMGPNGSGKSTLASTIAGHPRYNVTSGTVRFLGDKFLVRVAGCRQLAKVWSLGAVQDVCEVHVDLVVQDGDGKHGNRIIGWQLQRLAAAQVELGTVAPALDLAAFNFSFGEGDVRVRARVADGVDLPHRVLHDRYGVVIDQNPQRLLELDLAGVAD